MQGLLKIKINEKQIHFIAYCVLFCTHTHIMPYMLYRKTVTKAQFKNTSIIQHYPLFDINKTRSFSEP